MGLLRLGCVAAALSITAVVAPKPVLSPTQYAANGAFKAAKPEYWKGGTGTPEPAEREALYAELSALFDTVDWSDPAKDAPGLDNDTKLDKDSFAKYIGDAAKLSDSVLTEIFEEIDHGWKDYLGELLAELEVSEEEVAAVKAAGYEYIPQLKALEKMDPALKKAGVKKLAMRKTVKRAIEESAETHGDGKVERFEIASWWASKCWRKTSCVTCKNTPTCGWCLKKERCVADVPELCLGPGDHAGEYEWSIGQCEEDKLAAEATAEFEDALGITWGDEEEEEKPEGKERLKKLKGEL